jgi:hypothetical protein
MGTLTIATVIGVAGCSGGGSAVQASCTVSGSVPGASISVCEEIERVSPADLDTLLQSCGIRAADAADAGAQLSAQFVYGPCSRVDAIGGCQNTSGSTIITQWYYDDGTGSLTPSDVQMACTTRGGVFVQA